MNDLELILAHNVFINKGAYAILLGSGISSNAGIPTGWEILIKLIERLSILNKNPIDDDAEKWYRKNYHSEPNYSKLIELLTYTKEERINLLKPFFEIIDDNNKDDFKKPTIAHRAIAKLVKRGYIRVIVTTNFDRLMENALKEEGVEPTVISNPNHIDNVMPLIHSSITIIKVNGDYLDTSFLNIESELNFYDDRLIELLKNVFEDFGLITTGWSAKWDSGLRKVLEASNKFRFSNFFTHMNKCNEELQEIANFRRGRILQVDGADSFLKELLENIEALEKGEKNNPLSKPIAISRLKKYISKEEYKVELFELIQEEVQKDFKIIYDKVLPKADASVANSLIEFEINQLDILTSEVIHGVYWGKISHHDIWLKVISKFANPIRDRSGWALWSNLEYFPALILFYAIGLTAFYREDFLLLRKLYSIQIFNPYNEGERINILDKVNSYMVDVNTLNTILSKNQYAPMSELLYKIFKSHFAIWVSNDNEYEELFDKFELFTSLKYIELFEKNGMLPGRYRRRNRNNIIYKKFDELNLLKENIDWIKEELFKSHDSLQGAYKYFNDTIKTLGY